MAIFGLEVAPLVDNLSDVYKESTKALWLVDSPGPGAGAMEIQFSISEIIASIVGALFGGGVGSGVTWFVMSSKIKGDGNNVVNQSGATSKGVIVGRDYHGSDNK
ncbi:hypothetical protein [Asticcacaulis sp.]|uniref:hypothetical protein n=1 Tax=Asticcacaulis sp. TaxID=1872648 RepID=UPI0026021195|nr:hypothetical protein [Asticcacaulis sp.]